MEDEYARKLTPKQRKYLRDNEIFSLDQFKEVYEFQKGSSMKCFECRDIAKTLGLEEGK